MQSTEDSENIARLVGNYTANVCACTLIFSLLYSFYNDKALYRMLAKLRNIQILLVLAIFQLDVPRQATDFLSSMNKIVGFGSYFSFGLIDSDSVVSDSLSEQAHNLGFRSHLVMINNGSVYVMILSLLLASLFTRIASKTQIFSKKSRN